MIKITFPDGSVREYNEGVTGLQIAESISSRLAQDVLACGVNGEVYDLGRPISEDAEVVLYKWVDEQGKHAFWHTSAHLLAEAFFKYKEAADIEKEYRRSTSRIRLKLTFKIFKRWFMYTPFVRSMIMKSGVDSIDLWSAGK